MIPSEGNMASRTEKTVRGVPVTDGIVASPRVFYMSAPIQAVWTSALIGAAEISPRAWGTSRKSLRTRMTIAGRQTGGPARRSAWGAVSPQQMNDMGGRARGPQRETGRWGRALTGETEPVGTRVRASSRRPPKPSTQGNEGPQRDMSRGKTPAVTESAAVPATPDTEVALAKIHAVDEPRDSGAGELSPGVFLESKCARLRRAAHISFEAVWQLNSCWLFSGGSFGGCLHPPKDPVFPAAMNL